MYEPTQARAQFTRQKLLDAAVDVLVEDGYRALTTTAVAARAGVSRGAQQNYFPHKVTLVAEAVRHLSLRQAAELRDGIDGLVSGRTRTLIALDVLFEQYSGPLFRAVVELSLAAHSEVGLRETIAAHERQAARSIQEVAREILGTDYLTHPERETRWIIVLSTIRGLALLKVLGHPPESVDRQWQAARTELFDLLTHDHPADTCT